MNDPSTTIVLVAHAPSAAAFAELARHVFDVVPRPVVAIDITSDMSKAAGVELACATLDRRGVDGPVLLLADLVGSTPHGVAEELLKRLKPHAHLVTGLNAPMLVCSLAAKAGISLDDLARVARTRGRRGVQLGEPTR